MGGMLAAGFIHDDSRHYIDHLAPFCALMGWPLIVCESKVAELAHTFYPDLEVIEQNLWELTLPPNLVVAEPIAYLKGSFSLEKTTVFWLPHGNSDKGWQGASFEGLLLQEIALVYGKRMLDFMKAKGVVPDFIPIGNFRYLYYRLHKKFYDALIEPYRKENTIFYAPTWDDAEKNNSFWKAFEPLTQLDEKYQLLIKLHPNTAFKYAPEIEILRGKYQMKKNIVFIEDFPPIYPLLQMADHYLGDMSSIGYDFLVMNRPMWFLNPNQRNPEIDPGLSLFNCGKEVDLDRISFEENQEHLKSHREALCKATFDPIEDWENIKNQITQRLRGAK